MMHLRYSILIICALVLGLLLPLAATTAQAQPAFIVVLDCEPNGDGYLIPFAIVNNSPLNNLCRVRFNPSGPECAISSSNVPPTGWFTDLTPTGGAEFFSQPGECLPGGQTLPGFEIIVASNQPCCYLVEFFNDDNVVFHVDEVCVSPCGGEGPPAAVIMDNCTPVEDGTKFSFSIQNNFLQGQGGVCGFRLFPAPTAPCAITGLGSSEGWAANANPLEGGDWMAIEPSTCILPGQTRAGFSFTVPSAAGCCFLTQYTDAAGQVLFEEEVCFSCTPVSVEPSTWGTIKARYGSGPR